MSPLDALTLGIVEGITEFLPISSTGHLILASSLLNIEQTEFVKSFEIAIQFGAIAAVLCTYWRRFFEKETVLKLLAGFIPTALVGFTLYPFVKSALIGNVTVVIASLFLGGVFLIAFELLHRPKSEDPSLESISYGQAALIGLFQSVAIIPGVSRSGATIIGGLLLGVSRTAIVEFSFLLAVPTIAAAAGLDIITSIGAFSSADVLPLLIGFVSAFVTAAVAIRFLLGFIAHHTFISFGVYRIVFAVLFFLLLMD